MQQHSSRTAHQEAMHGTPAEQVFKPGRRTSSQRSSGVCGTPQECATMMDAVEQAMAHAQYAPECTPDSHPTRSIKGSNLQEWLKTSGLQMPTPAARDLQSLVEAAADNRRLRRQLEALREAELELAAREAEETALNFSMLEEENTDLAARNAQLQQRIAELEALAQAAEAAAQAQQQQQQQQQEAASPEPITPQHQRLRATGLGEPNDMQERATSVLKRAAAASRLSGMYEEEQQARLRQLSEAEGRLSAMKAQAPASTHSQQSAMQLRLSAAEQQVQEAAAAAQKATQKLQAVLREKEEVQAELAALRQQLEAQPAAAAQHAELYTRLLEAQQQLLQEKHQHQQLAGSLLEHAGRLSHKYYKLSDDYDALEHRYHQLSRANEHLSDQLKEAHETLYELQTAVRATPVHKRREQQHLMLRLHDAEQAVQSLAEEKQQLQERLLQAHAFISCLQQHTGWSAPTKTAASGQQQHRPALLQTPSDVSAAAAGATTAMTPEFASTDSVRATAEGLVLALPVPAAADTAHPAPGAAVARQCGAEVDDCPASFATPPAMGHSNPLFDLPATPGSQLMSGEPGAAHAATAVVPHGYMTWPQDPASPILAAATRSTAVGEHRQRVQHTAATHELQDVHQEQLGLREEISRAKSALADIAGQLRASIGAAAVSKASSASAGGSVVGGYGRAATAGASSRVNLAMTTPASTSSGGSHDQDPLQATASAARSSNSRSSTGTAATASHGSRAKGSAGRIHGPCKLQELQKAAAAVKSVSAAMSGSSGSKGSMIASKATSDFSSACRTAAGAGGAPSASAGQRSRSKHWDELSDSCSDTSSSPGQSAGSSASAPAAHASAAGLGLVVRAAASGQGPSRSDVKGAAPEVPAGSGKGSISLDQLIADAETISLEYGMSPGGPATGTPAAAAAASAAQATSTPVAHSCPAVAGVAGVTPDQQALGSTLQHFAFVARPVSQLVTPRSASSSAGAGAGRLVTGSRAWLTQRQLEGTPASAVVNHPQPDDMQSCIRSGRGSHAPLPGPQQQQQATPAAPTPMGLERVASNTLLDALDTAAAGLQDQQQQLLLPGATGSVCATEAAATGCGSSVQQQDAMTPGSTAAGAAAADAGVSGLLSGSRVGTASVLVTLQQQQGSVEGGASACSSAPVTPSGAGAAACTPPAPLSSPPSALKKAAAALLSSISPAGLMTAATPEGQGPTGAMAAAAAAGLSPQLLQHLTPEWLRSLKRKCKQESEQLQLLRRQMGLATPEADVSPQELQLLQVLPALPQQQPLDTAVRPAGAGASAAGPGEGSSSCVAAAAAACGGISAGCLDDTQLGAAGGSCCQGSGAEAVELSMHQVQDDGMLGATAACSSMSSRAGAAAGLTGSSSSLGLLSSRSSIDRLRRRAIMAQANAASASPLPLDQDAVTAASAALEVCPVAATTAASQVVGCAAADTAMMDDQLDRCSSAGSLAEYMRQHSLRDDSAPVSRTSSITPGMYPARPECPTPGSLYSDINDAVGSADEALLGWGALVSPDMLLAGLQSSRAAARQLQHQLMQQLEKTTSMPSVLSRQHEAVLRAVVPALHRTNSAAATVAAAAAGAHNAEELSHSCCDSPALEASTQLLVAPQAAPQAAGLPTGLDPAASGLTAAAQARSSTCSSSTGSRQARPLHQQMSRLMEEEQQAAASPATPGAALNAGAESRLLSPSVQLQLVFEGEGSGDEASTAEVGSLEQQPGHVQEVDDFNMQQQPQQCPSGTDLNTCSTFLPLQQVHQQQGQQQLPVVSLASPQASDSGSCMLPLGIAAKAQPAADSAVAAPSPPVSVLSATPGSAWPQASVKAHQLSGVSAGTFTESTPLSVYDGIEPQSCARAPTMVPAATAAEVACAVGELTSASPAIHEAADAAAGAGSVAASMLAAIQGQGLMGGAASRSHSSSSPSCSHAISEGGPSLGSWAAADTPAAAQADATAAAQSGATPNSTLLGSSTSPGHAQQQGDATRSLPILLGESPSTKPQQPRTHKGGYSSTPASTATNVSAAGAAASSASVTSGSCLTSAPTPHLSLGRSPGSEVESAHVPAGNVEATASITDAGTTVTAAAGSCKPGDAGVEVVNTAAAAAAAIAAAFAAPQAAGSAAPAVSSTTWGSGSCMFATPAVEFNSLGGAYSCGSEGSDGQVYYTGLQHSSHSSRHVAATAAPSGRGPAGQDQSAQTAGGGPEVAFAGFRVTERYHTEDEGISSPVTNTRAAGSVAAEVGGINHGAAAPVVTATAQKKLLQQLLASPGDDEASEASPESPLAAEEPNLPDTTTASSAQPAPAAAAAALTVELAGVGAEEPGVDAVLSPTLSELGFVAASTSADVATAKRLQQEQQQQELRQGKSRGVAADLDGLSFEQRLDLLCAEDASSSEGSPVQLLGAAAGGTMHQQQQQHQQQQAVQLADSCSSATSSSGVGSSSKCLGPRSNGGGGPDSAEGINMQEDEAALTGAPGLQGSMACCATQTSPLPVGFASTSQDWDSSRFKEAGVQVPTPAAHGPQAKKPEAACEGSLASTTKLVGTHVGRPCDVSASPIKGRDQC